MHNFYAKFSLDELIFLAFLIYLVKTLLYSYI